MDKLLSALEITSSGIKLAVGYYNQGRVHILHALESTGAKLENGNIVDEEEMTNAMKELFLTAEKTLGMKIENVILGFPSIDLSIMQARSVTNTTDPESRVTLFDGSNCMAMIGRKEVDDAGKRAVIDIVPYQYILDKEVTFPDFPSGKISNSLAMCADVEMIDGIVIQSFSKCVNNAGARVLKTVNVTNASIKYINSFQKSMSEFVFVDIGSRLTTLGYAYGSRLMKSEVVNFGGDYITDAIAQKFGLSFAKAEEYKKIYGLSHGPNFKYVTPEGFTIDDLYKCIETSLQTLVARLSAFDMTLEASARNLFVLSGGGADLSGINAYFANQFQNRVILFTPTCYGARNKAYTNCVSMIAYYANYEIKTSPSRPVDLTLTRMMPALDDDSSVKVSAGKKKSGLGDEEL